MQAVAVVVNYLRISVPGVTQYYSHSEVNIRHAVANARPGSRHVT